MKVETPQILWNSEGDKNVNAALLSVAVLSCGGSSNGGNSGSNGNNDPSAAAASASSVNRGKNSAATTMMILATAGNSSVVNLWAAAASPSSGASSDSAGSGAGTTPSTTNLAFRCSLGRQDGACNCVRFSPNGMHLAAASEQAVVVWTVPPQYIQNNNSGTTASNHQVSQSAAHFWSNVVAREQDLQFKVAARNGEAFMDLAWSADSTRIVAGSIDHSVVVCEYSAEQEAWRTVYRHDDHAHFVQGVAFDPLNVYVASMSSDRTVRVHGRKKPPTAKNNKGRKASLSLVASNVLAATTKGNADADAPSMASTESAVATTPTTTNTGGAPTPVAGAAAVDTRKLEITKSKLIKYYRTPAAAPQAAAAATSNSSSFNSETQPSQQQQQHKHLYQDEATLESFVRRLAFTADGAYLVTPAAQWWRPLTSAASADDSTNSSSASYANATLMFARHKWDEPCRVLVGMQKPSVAVRPCPVLFQLPDEAKENAMSGGLPYRSVFCVLTWDSVLVYDTFHAHPLAILSGLHYCNLVDAAWSDDGRILFVCSTDGYVSIVQFDDGELGHVYVPPPSVAGGNAAATTPPPVSDNVGRTPASTTSKPPQQPTQRRLPVPSPGPPTLPPCEPGLASIEAPPCKRAKVQGNESTPVGAASPAAVASPAATGGIVGGDRCHGVSRGADEAIGIGQLTIDEPKAKKKRIQPTFVAATN